ncbi:hypothetical protein [Peribacillus sp. SCS-155]|uniref:hypothetical protein n=1 Tax=Peribacillus sedimenti TaxID=3115297 RepID=UPI003905A35E
MTLQSPEWMLNDAFSSALSYSIEILEDKAPREELLALVSNFLEQAAKLNQILQKRNESERLRKEFLAQEIWL